ncbi:PAS domain-containing sensor histidine kinase [Mucilaginibacter glaciei]|uniref:histidine kinase n=1 Tax=Mucilaginibacter glaciei TaxID=2772109 RepID=A0A926S5G0_9SPHI|nr:PAS domain-containing sensor histidine kinase [Mucilaginibacter glaciei]MBD1392711.1 PAS domain-containing protein [Mucilaginibacter glaciei]
MQNPNAAPGLNEQSFHNLMAQAPVAISVLRGSDMVIESANKMMLEVWGKPAAVIGKPLIQGLPELKGQPFFDLLQNVYTTGNPYYGYESKILLIRNGIGERCYFNFVYQAIVEANGAISGIMVIATEVTGQVIARRQMEDAEERLRLAADATGLGTWDLDLQNGGIIHAPRLAEIFGRNSKIKLRHTELRDIVHPADLHIVTKAFDKALATSVYFYEARVIWPDGTVHWIRTNGKVYFDDSKTPLRMLGTVTDITEQRRILDSLKKSEESFRLATDAAELGTFDMDLQTMHSVWNARHRALFGVFDSAMTDYNQIFAKSVHPDDHKIIDKAFNRACNKKLSNGDYDAYYRTIGIEDKKLRWIRAKGKILFNDQNEPVRLIGAIVDITETKQNELRKNDFVAMASHELKTPLTSLKAYIQLLLVNAKRSGDSFVVNALEKSESQVNKMTNLIYGFLDLAKLESAKLTLKAEVFDLAALVEEVVSDARPISQGHCILFDNTAALSITADREKIGQVISNFINNAVKYSPKNTDVIVTLISDKNIVKVEVTDNGIGIKESDQQNIFQRFYRVEDESTKGFSGFGIGLYLSAEIIALHQGKIGVVSKGGGGSTFYFTLPVR